MVTNWSMLIKIMAYEQIRIEFYKTIKIVKKINKNLRKKVIC